MSFLYYLVYTINLIGNTIFVQMKSSHLRFSFNAVTCKSGSCVFIYLCTVAFYLDNHGLLVAKINFIYLQINSLHIQQQ